MHRATRRLKHYSIGTKLDAIRRVENGESQAHVAHELHAGPTTVNGWILQKQKIKGYCDRLSSDSALQRMKIRDPDFTEIDQRVYDWFVSQRTLGIPLSGTLICDKALAIAEQLYGTETSFEGSRGWFNRWQRRHGISQHSIHGEVRSSDNESATTFRSSYPSTVAGYHEDQLYNADEAGLFWKLLPDKTQDATSNPQNSGFKGSKERVTLLFAANSSGKHKVKLFVIGKSMNPRCLHHMNAKKLPVIYKSSKNAWMTQTLFREWFFEVFVVQVRKYLRSQHLDEKAILFMDRCSAHPNAEELVSNDEKIKVIYFPANTTPLIQPMDQGIIATFKRCYRREFIREILLNTCVTWEELKTAMGQFNIKKMMYKVSFVWENMTAAIISNCWKKGLTVEVPLEPAVVIDEEELDISEITNMLEHTILHSTVDKVEEFLTAEDLLPTEQPGQAVEWEEQVAQQTIQMKKSKLFHQLHQLQQQFSALKQFYDSSNQGKTLTTIH